MRSTFAGLNTVVLGLAAQKLSLDTVGHNVANANTDGYSRQRVNLVTSYPQSIYTGAGRSQIGTGVLGQSITRIRDTFMDQQMWKESSTLGYGETLLGNLNKIQGVFSDPNTDTGMQSVLDSFWKSWNSLAEDGSNNGARKVVRERGVELVDAIQHASTQLQNMVSDINSVLKIRVDTVNQITSEMLSLNKQIMQVEASGTDHANDLRDRRDLLVDQLSKMMNVRVTEEKNGTYTVQSSGVTLVDANNITKLVTKSKKDPDYGYEVVNIYTEQDQKDDTKPPINFTDGEIKGLIDSRDKTADSTTGNSRESDISAKAYLNKLSKMSQFLLQEFNSVHRDGYGLSDDDTGYNFFGVSKPNPPAVDNTDYSNSTNFTALFGHEPTAKDWIDQLRVNEDMFNSVNGLNHIAAKTKVGSLTVSQSDPSAPKIRLGGDYPAGVSLPANYTVTVNRNADGTISNVSYSYKDSKGVDSGAINVTPPFSESANGTTKISLGSLSITVDTKNTKGTACTYTFTTLKEAQNNAAGDNATNMYNRLKQDISATLESSSLDTFYGSVIGALGVQTQNIGRLKTNQTTLVNQITNWRSSVSGVNLDEDLSDMIRFQKGYNSAARILTAMDEMLDKLINGTGAVGR
ncbi:hypothetical protein SRRS_39880 [Sporomusa rhizae]|uniref:flagellar hook-associated protein FlgK n=1 Tax=Sporomusa rhizae TaxID=357999 RepID=UPI00352B4FE9